MSAAGLQSPEDARAKAYKLLDRRDLSAAELAERLGGAGHEPGVVEVVVGELIELEVVDDSRMARRLATDARDRQGFGRERIGSMLRRRRVGEDDVIAALAALDPEAEAARRALSARFAELPSSDADRGRAIGYLMRRGFGEEVACATVLGRTV